MTIWKSPISDKHGEFIKLATALKIGTLRVKIAKITSPSNTKGDDINI